MRILLVVTALLALGYAAPQFGYDQPTPPLAPPGSSLGGPKYLPPDSAAEAPLIHKQFYTISAPEDNSNDGRVKHLVLGRPQRNYRVVFIKAPDSDNSKVKYSAEFAPQEEKTVVYVLTKKDNELNAKDIATAQPAPPSKPEVFFIKYKTPEEADHAQKEIQEQYDKLGGTSEISNEDSAPVTSVVGSLDGLNPDGSYNYHQIASKRSNNAVPKSINSNVIPPALTPNGHYLPSSLRY